MTDAMTGVLTRIGELDLRIRSIDPGWAGLGLPLAAGVAGSGAPGASADAFAGVLATLAAPEGGTTDPAEAATAAPRSAARLVLPAQAGTAGEAGAGAASVDGRLVDPVPGATVTQPFGPSELELEPAATIDGITYAHFHRGIDLAAALGTPVHAAAAGTVIAAGRESDGAVIVRLRHADGSETLYGHLDPAVPVQVGDHVEAGDVIGAIGLTGRTTGPHLHFELTRGGQPVDPAPLLAGGSIYAAGAAGALDGSAQETLARFDAAASEIPYAAEIRAAAVTSGVDPFLLASLVEAESSFHPDARSWAGAMGLTQLMPATASALGVTDPFDPAQNLAGGARYLAGDLRLYGRTDLALAAYQAGKGSVAAAGGRVPDNPTTQAYVRRILTRWSRYLEGAAA